MDFLILIITYFIFMNVIALYIITNGFKSVEEKKKKQREILDRQVEEIINTTTEGGSKTDQSDER